MGINNNPFFEVTNLIEVIEGNYTNPVAQALLEAEIWERKGISTLASCVEKDQDSPFVQSVIMQGQWKLEVAANYLDAAVWMETHPRS
jgi:hypothetical protein